MDFKPEGVKIFISVASGMAKILMLRALTLRKMPNIFKKFRQDAKNVNCDEFDEFDEFDEIDEIEVHDTNRCLLDPFFKSGSIHLDRVHGGSLDNRLRLPWR